MFEVVIIGGGIVGGFIFNTLARHNVSVLLLDKKDDVSCGATKANSGIIHAGYDAMPGTLKARFNVEGNKMYNEIARRLNEEINECGSLVVGDKNSLGKIKVLYERGIKNGVEGLEILDREKLLKLEPNLNDDICFGLYAKTAKVISPYKFNIALFEEALLYKGAKVQLKAHITDIKKDNLSYYHIFFNDKEVVTKFLINASAEGANEIGGFLSEEEMPLKFVKGEYMLLDKSEKSLVNHIIFPLPTNKGKGIVVCKTISGNVFLGPTANEVKTYDTSFSYDSINTIKSSASLSVKNINFKKVIKLYAGVRVVSNDDFVIKFSEKNKNYVALFGICSPGLTASPAIAKYVFEKLVSMGLVFDKNPKEYFRKPYTNTLSLDTKSLNALIKKDQNYGEIVCNCEKITKGEILEVLSSPFPPLSLDGIKRRLRTTMGHCQGAFCYPKLIKIVSDFLKVPEEEIYQKENGKLVFGNIKEGGIYE